MLLLKHKACKETKANLAVGCAKLLQILLTKKKKQKSERLSKTNNVTY